MTFGRVFYQSHPLAFLCGINQKSANAYESQETIYQAAGVDLVLANYYVELKRSRELGLDVNAIYKTEKAKLLPEVPREKSNEKEWGAQRQRKKRWGSTFRCC